MRPYKSPFTWKNIAYNFEVLFDLKGSKLCVIILVLLLQGGFRCCQIYFLVAVRTLAINKSKNLKSTHPALRRIRGKMYAF